MSGLLDSNQRPPVPQTGILNLLNYIPKSLSDAKLVTF